MKRTYLVKSLRPLQAVLLTAGAVSLMLSVGQVNAADDSMQQGGAMGQESAQQQLQQAGAPGQLESNFSKLDVNHDGYISQDEARAQPNLESDFANVDTNSDGEIDQTEFSAFETQQQQQGGEMQTPENSTPPSESQPMEEQK